MAHVSSNIVLADGMFSSVDSKEASLMCQLKHPNIVGFIGAVTEPANLAIITQYCARGSLADLLLEHRIDMNFKLKMKFAICTWLLAFDQPHVASLFSQAPRFFFLLTIQCTDMGRLP